MNRHDLLADSLRLHLRASADERPAPGQLDTILSQTATIRPRPHWLASMHRGTTGIWERAGATPAVRLAGVVVLVAVLAVLAVAFVIGQRQRVGGLLGFSRDGSVYISQPGSTSSVVAAAVPGYHLDVMTRERAWSPDGRYLAVDGFETPSSDPESPPTAFVLDSRTLDLRRIGQGYFLGWMSDGRALVASGNSSMATYSIDDQTIQMSGQVKARNGGNGVLSPDGHWLAVMQGQFLARVDVQTGETKLLYDNGGELVDTPAWSPDSSRIAFARTLSPRCHTCMGPILVVTVDGSRVTPVSRPDSLAFRPKWSPEGDWLAYITDVNHAGVENSSIEIARPDGTERRTLSTGRPADLAWSPDGTRIRYQTDALDEAESRYTLVEIDPMDGQTRRVDDGAGVEGFAWQSLPGGSSIPPLPPEVR